MGIGYAKIEVEKAKRNSLEAFMSALITIQVVEYKDTSRDTDILNMVESSIIQSILSIDLIGIPNFIQRSLRVHKEALASYMLSFSEFKSKDKSAFLFYRLVGCSELLQLLFHDEFEEDQQLRLDLPEVVV